MNKLTWIEDMGYMFDDSCCLEPHCMQYGSCDKCDIDSELKEDILQQVIEIETIKKIPILRSKK